MPLSGPQSSIVNVFTSGSLTTPLPVTSTQTSPVWVTGNLNASVTAIESSVGGTGSVAPFSAALMGAVDGGGQMVPLTATSAGWLWVTGSQTINNFPLTQSVKLDQTITVPVTMSTAAGSAIWVTGNIGSTNQVTASVPNLTASISNFPVTQSIVANITQSITLPVTMSTSQVSAIWVTGSTGGTSQVTASIPAPVTITSTIDNPAWVAISGTVTASIVGNLPVTSTVAAPVWVTASQTNPVGITGTVFVSNITGPQTITSTLAAPAYVAFVSQSVTGTVHIDNTSFSTTFVSQSVTGTVSIGNVIPTHGVTFVSQSVTGTVSIGNAVSVTSTVASPVYVVTKDTMTGPPTIAVVTASSTSQQLFAANANRIGVTIQNFAASNAVFVNLNTSEARFNSATVRIAGNGYWEMPFRYTGSIQIAASGTQTAIAIGQEFTG